MNSATDTGLVDYSQIDSLLEVAGRDGVNEILRAFWKSTDKLLRDLANEVAAQDFTSAARTSHAIKGSAANVGAHLLAGAARDVEASCKMADRAGALAAVTRAVVAYEKTRTALTARIENAA